MRELKLRVWDKQHKRFLNKDDYWKDQVFINLEGNLVQYGYEENVDRPQYLEQVPDAERYIVIQYTGLKDMPGNEIYEGDILSDVFMDSIGQKIECRCIISWDEGSSTWWAGGINSSYSGTLVGETFSKGVIGNIYESPELLEAK